jgi:uncharacterized protein (TIGR03086 family)
MMSDDQTSQVQLLTGASTSTRNILENVTSEQLTHPTPCNDWQVRDLIDHIVGATRFFADIAEQGSSPEGQDWPGYADGDFVSSFAEWAGRAVAGFSAAGAMQQNMLLPTGPTPGSRCMQVATAEIFVHGWDLARATGQSMPPDAGVADALLSSWWASLCAEVRQNDPPPFAPEIDVPRDAPALDRLTGFLGRDPGWSAAL